MHLSTNAIIFLYYLSLKTIKYIYLSWSFKYSASYSASHFTSPSS